MILLASILFIKYIPSPPSGNPSVIPRPSWKVENKLLNTSTLSYNFSKSHILLRKKDKLPAERYSVDFELEYGKATLEIHQDSISSKEKVIIVDDLIATGGTAEAAAKLVEKSGGEVAGFIFVINLFDLGGKDLLEKKGYKTFSLLDFPGH